MKSLKFLAVALALQAGAAVAQPTQLFVVSNVAADGAVVHAISGSPSDWGAHYYGTLKASDASGSYQVVFSTKETVDHTGAMTQTAIHEETAPTWLPVSPNCDPFKLCARGLWAGTELRLGDAND